jgi:RHS repeat-associated protein
MAVSGQSEVNYTFDNASRLTSIAQGAAHVFFTYDSDYRRTSLTLPNGVTASYGYDTASQLTGIVYQGGALAPANLSYTYDLAGRRTSVSGTLASTQLPNAVSNAVYNANNQLTQWGTTAMTYDANGNTLNDGMNTYVWDARNRLVSADSNSATFAYDPLSRRNGKNILAANTNYLYDGANPVQELNGSVTANLLTGGVDEYFTRIDSTGTSNFLTDALGSTVELTDSGGNPQVQYGYGPFGAISITGTTNNSYTYTGRETDGLGLYYNRARYYNPSIGRFLSEDPIGFAGGINKYAYVGNSPTNWIDSFGYAPGDKWYGFNNRDFQDWFHRNWKQPGDPDAGPEDMADAFNEWKSQGSPQRDSKGNRRMAGRGSCEGPQGEPAPAPEPATEPEPESDPNLLQQALSYASAHPGQVALGAGVVVVGGAIIVLSGGSAIPILVTAAAF